MTAATTTASLLLLGMWGSGCSHSDSNDAQNPSGATATASPAVITANAANAPAPGAASVPGGGGATAPPLNGPMMGTDNPTAPLTPTPDLDKKIADALRSGNKKRIGDAYTVRGRFRMEDDNAGARVKYRKALDDYRDALRADPANAEAKKWKDTIESIYKSMGRPIPKDATASE